jgi:hypothetical protein
MTKLHILKRKKNAILFLIFIPEMIHRTTISKTNLEKNLNWNWN